MVAFDAATDVVVNGPAGVVVEIPSWSSVDWARVERDVRRLRARIFTASRNGDLRKVRSLQRLMLRSRANALDGVRRVTQRNTGRATAGIDGKTALLDSQRAELAWWVQSRASRRWKSLPVKRVYIPKKSGKKRPLGIPVIRDRALQATVLAALEPEWEARFEGKSYGFRPGRGCHDAIEAIFTVLGGRHPSRRVILDADLTAAFDRIDHQRLLAALGGFPGRRRIAAWLRAGVIEDGLYAPTEQGTPQGGVISPLLLNIALHGMEQAAGVRYHPGHVKHAGKVVPGAPILVRYADDLVVMCTDLEQVAQVQEHLARWLAPRGLTFNQEKTRIVSIDEGFDFLGFNVRRYRNGKLLIKPSKDAIRRIRRRLAAEVHALHGANAAAVITRLNPIIKGWAAYYRTVVSKEIFNALDHYVWKLTYRWARRRHPNKGKRWVAARYFAAFHPTRRDRWVFGDRDTGRYLVKFSWTSIVRHTLVTGRSSPDDPTLTAYWTRRRRRNRPPVGPFLGGLLTRQHGRCPRCHGLLLAADHIPGSPAEWEQWHRTIRLAIRKSALVVTDPATTETDRVLMHAYCAKRTADTTGPPLGLA